LDLFNRLAVAVEVNDEQRTSGEAGSCVAIKEEAATEATNGPMYCALCGTMPSIPTRYMGDRSADDRSSCRSGDGTLSCSNSELLGGNFRDPFAFVPVGPFVAVRSSCWCMRPAIILERACVSLLISFATAGCEP